MARSGSLPGALTPRQRRAVEALACGGTVTSAAESAGVGRRTLTRWLTEPHVSRALDRAVDSVIADARRRLAGEVDRSIEALIAVRDDPEAPAGARVSAAREMLDRALGRPRQEVEHSGEVRTGEPHTLILEVVDPPRRDADGWPIEADGNVLAGPPH